MNAAYPMKHLPQEQGSAGAVSSSLRPGAQYTPADWLELLSAFTTRSSELIAAYTAAQIRKDVKDGV